MSATGYRAMANVNARLQMQGGKIRKSPVQAPSQEHQRAECEAYGEADEIEIRPGHGRRLLSPACCGFAASGVSASSNRSARPGVSRIAPSRRKQRRVSWWRAALIR